MATLFSALRRKQKSVVRAIPWVVLIGVLLYAAAAGIADKQFQWLQPPGWSRAKLMATTTLNEPVPLAIDGAGNIYLLVFSGMPTSSEATVIAYDVAGVERWRQEVGKGLAEPVQPQLVWRDGRLLVFWLVEGVVYQTVVSAAGELVGARVPLAYEVEIASYAVVSGRDGVHLWAAGDNRESGLYAQVGEKTAVLIDPDGTLPLLQLDDAGYVQAIWLRQVTATTAKVMYGGSNASGDWFANPTELLELNAGSGTRLRGPWFVVENGFGHLAWSIELLSGLSAGQSLSQATAFSLEQTAVPREPTDFQLPYRRQRDYSQPADGIQAGARAVIDPAGRQASPLQGAALVSPPGVATEGVLALRVSVEHLKQKEVSQIALYYLKNGVDNGYQLLSFSADGSMSPAVVLDEAGGMVVAWLERAQGTGFNLYLAGTSPLLQETFAQLTGQDYGLFLIDTLFGMLQSVTFVPFSFFLWAVGPLLLIVVTGWLRKDEQTWRHPAFWLPLLTAVLIYTIAKYLTLRDALWYVPFSAWIPIIPGWMGWPLRIVTPVAITALAAYIAWRVSYGSQRRSLLLLFFLYAGIDALLAMSIYGGVLYNAL